jgi:hypothetical protein
MTTLTTPELIDPKRAPQVIHALDRHNSPDFLLNLRNLVYSECDSDAVDNWLLNVQNSRCAAGRPAESPSARLESFRLIWRKYPLHKRVLHVAHLRMLATGGMRIHIGTSHYKSLY